MKIIIGLLLFFYAIIGFANPSNHYLNLSYQFLEELQAGSNTYNTVLAYQNITLDSLAEALDTEDKKKAFWLNTYNGFVQQILLKNPELFENRGEFFTAKRINIAGILMSFDDIEHGIIRASRWKLSLGYLRKPFSPKYVRLLRTKKPDGRVHFALNCGAKSCPPIATFHAASLNQELDKITKQYLQSTTKLSDEAITITPLMSWFRADFGGKKGIKKDFLLAYDIVPSTAGKNLVFDTYDWTLSLGNYTAL
ncbi:MAG: DUF547 domain-containing protein [Putridiphycobacter sp.]|nr:DUF547 domain-containing protein [Putridiphycobacter sp.]